MSSGKFGNAKFEDSDTLEKWKMTELIDADLDLAVAKALGKKAKIVTDEFAISPCGDTGGMFSGCVIESLFGEATPMEFSPTANWSQGGPLIAEHWNEITNELYHMFPREFPEGHDWYKQIKGKDFLRFTMQALVTAKEK